jgi:hypothetical protein
MPAPVSPGSARHSFVREQGGHRRQGTRTCTSGDLLVKMFRLALRQTRDGSKLRVAMVEDEQDRGYQDVGELTDDQLEAELTIAASTPDHRRMERYQALLAERERREQDRD